MNSVGFCVIIILILEPKICLFRTIVKNNNDFLDHLADHSHEFCPANVQTFGKETKRNEARISRFYSLTPIKLETKERGRIFSAVIYGLYLK